MKAANIQTGTSKVRSALLIDDDKFMLTVLRDMLEEMGVSQIATATNGSAGIKSYDSSAQPPDLIVSDLSMPGSDGFEFMEQLSSRKYGGGIVLVSGMDDRTMHSATLMAKFHRLNILETLSKPVESRAMATALARL